MRRENSRCGFNRHRHAVTAWLGNGRLCAYGYDVKPVNSDPEQSFACAEEELRRGMDEQVAGPTQLRTATVFLLPTISAVPHTASQQPNLLLHTFESTLVQPSPFRPSVRSSTIKVSISRKPSCRTISRFQMAAPTAMPLLLLRRTLDWTLLPTPPKTKSTPLQDGTSSLARPSLTRPVRHSKT